jgi:hypothetical protein
MLEERQLCCKNSRQGGVILHVRDDIVSYELPELNVIKAEVVWCKIKTGIVRWSLEYARLQMGMS